ncbi:hypothetical protein EJF18_80201 [Clavispora lusitaniae]|uniref:Uncharacterized protein n=2 Tax=Clavispora lusitaniae TaxID=36911 RepID=A0ACD0WSE1_CLALS|nr:hypothetical protein EJF14_80201 [Clavispora lusitaniae]QFZ36144.1 hypothetical protein EJF16_80201 [Clavispora lusitaniae]QFZ41828.1 hypothetical protein EJF15_80201 [Clavispora lusitaniae]QFZ47504.1 hypothetical protein EJF18_80201 [Clavispora lusitaniae]QFZ53183.1 hypothetical protein EJF17_80201 [Clavispora lusitaniae]
MSNPSALKILSPALVCSRPSVMDGSSMYQQEAKVCMKLDVAASRCHIRHDSITGECSASYLLLS